MMIGGGIFESNFRIMRKGLEKGEGIWMIELKKKNDVIPVPDEVFTFGVLVAMWFSMV